MLGAVALLESRKLIEQCRESLRLAEKILERDRELLGDAYRQMLQEHLAEAEQHVTEGARHVAEQQQRVAQMERGGHEVGEATRLLGQFEEMQTLHTAHRDRLRKQLGQAT